MKLKSPDATSALVQEGHQAQDPSSYPAIAERAVSWAVDAAIRLELGKGPTPTKPVELEGAVLDRLPSAIKRAAYESVKAEIISAIHAGVSSYLSRAAEEIAPGFDRGQSWRTTGMDRGRMIMDVLLGKLRDETAAERLGVCRQTIFNDKHDLSNAIALRAFQAAVRDAMTPFLDRRGLCWTELTVRAWNVMEQLFYPQYPDRMTMGEMLSDPKFNKLNLSKQRNCGRKTIREIEEAVEEGGLPMPRDTADNKLYARFIKEARAEVDSKG